jgi:hypothetical protein
MKNKNLILLLAAGAAYWYFFMYKKKAVLQTSQPGTPDQPGQTAPASQMQSAVTTEAVTIVEQLKSFNEQPMRTLEHKQDEVYQTYYVNQVNGVKKMGVPFTI